MISLDIKMNFKDQKFYDSAESQVGNIPRMIELFQDEAFLNAKLQKYPDSIIFHDKNLWSNPTFLTKAFTHGGSKISSLNTPHFFNNKTAIKIILEESPIQLHKFHSNFFHNNESLLFALDIYLQAKCNNAPLVNEHFKVFLLITKLLQSSFYQSNKNELFNDLNINNQLEFSLAYFHKTLAAKESERIMQEELKAVEQPHHRGKQLKF